MATSDLPTPDDLVQAAQAKLRSKLDPGGTGAVDLRAGSELDTLVSVAAALASRNTSHIAERLKQRSIRSATGADLEAVGQDLKGLKKKLAAAATGFVYVQRTGTAATTIPAGTRFAVPQSGTQKAVVFTADADVPVALGDTGSPTPIAVAATCADKGLIGNVKLTAITNIPDPLPDTTWSIATPPGGALDFGGGADDEDEETYRARLFEAVVEPGTAAGVKTGAKNVPGVLDATVIEPLDGTLVVVVGDANYLLPAALKTTVTLALNDWRPLGPALRVQPYTVVDVAVTATLYMQRALPNYDTAKLQADAVAAVTTYFKNRAHPDEYFLAAIEAAVMGVHAETQDVVLAAPNADVKRFVDSSYSGLSALTRYVLSTVQVTLSGPLTQ